MANGFSNMTFTTNGLNLLAKAQAGKQLNFTRIAVGSGTCSDPSALNELISEKMSLNISQIVVNGTMATLCSFLDNASLVTGFDWKEIGVFATDPDIGEILFGWAGAGSGMISIPAGTTSVFTTPLNIGVLVTNVANVTATINSSLVFLTQNGNGSQLTETFIMASTVTDILSGDANATIFGKIKKWFSSFGSAAWLSTGTTSGTVATGDHTHIASAITNFAAQVIAQVLTGFVTTVSSAVTAADSIVVAIGKLQAQITAHLADYIRNPGYVADTGVVNAIVITPSPALTAYADGVIFNIKMKLTNTATAVTVNANGLGVKTAYRADGTALAIGDLVLNKVYEFSYNSTIGGFMVCGIEQAQITAHLADYIRNPGYVADTGAVNAIVITPSPALAAYADGVIFNIKMKLTNTATAITVNVNAIGAKTAYRADGTALAIGDLVLNKVYEFSYNSTIGGFTVYGIEQAQITSHVANTSNPHGTTPAQLGAGTLGGQVNANATAEATQTTAQVRDIYFGTTDMTAGTTALTNGVLYGYYV